jgi:hypothetical protein
MVFLALMLLVLVLLLARAIRPLVIPADRLHKATFLVLNKAFLEIIVQEYRFSTGFLSQNGISLIDWIFVQPMASGFFKI